MGLRLSLLTGSALVGALLVACSSGEASPSGGSYTVQFPSTAAAVATDFVQVLVFDSNPAIRATICQDLVVARIRGDELTPSVPPQSPPPNICEMLASRKPLTVPYGEKALLAIAQRKDQNDQLRDFLVGCAVMTVGDGDAPLAIPLRLISVTQPVPETQCGSVGEYCDDRCR